MSVSFFLHVKADLHVYLVPIRAIPAGPSRGAAVILNNRLPAVKSLNHEPRLWMQVSGIVRRHEYERRRTNQPFRPRLTTYSLYLADLVEGYAVLAEETAMCYKVPLETVRREYHIVFFGRRARRADKGRKRYWARRERCPGNIADIKLTSRKNMGEELEKGRKLRRVF